MNFPNPENPGERPQGNSHSRNLGIILILAFLSPYINTLIRMTRIPILTALSILRGSELETPAYLVFYSIIPFLPPLVTLMLVVILGIVLLRGKKRGYVFLLIAMLIIIFANQYVLTKIDLIESVKTDAVGKTKEFRDYFRKTYELDK